jgi:hypothetical protein
VDGPDLQDTALGAGGRHHAIGMALLLVVIHLSAVACGAIDGGQQRCDDDAHLVRRSR